MCGFAGIYQPEASLTLDNLRSRVGRMSVSIAHRGPDDDGVWCDPAAGIALAHRRLAIIDVSPLGHQPMFSASGRFVIVFNGEIYNFQSLREQLGAGVHYRGGSDTEVMLACFERWGVEQSLNRFNGMFGFALWDREEREVWLARDRLGEKPVYYGWAGRELLFGSELLAFTSHPEFEREIDRGVLAQYFRHNYVPGPYSIYKGARKLPAGSIVRFSNRLVPGLMPEPMTYWSPEASFLRGPANIGEQEAIEELERKLLATVRSRMIADVPLGAFLSGGIDSSLIVALMQKAGSRAARTFTIGFREDGYNEAPHARDVAKHLGTDHNEFVITAREALDVIPRLSSIYDEPFADASAVPTVLLSQLVRRSVTVSLTGDGGDEMFAGYSRYFWHQSFWRKLSILPTPLRKAIASSLAVMPATVFGATAAMLGKPQRNPAENQSRLRAMLLADTPESAYQELISVWNNPSEIVLGALAITAKRSLRVQGTSRLMLADMLSYLPDDILVKVDRASMSVGLEGRAPLLDHDIAEFAASLPMNYKVRDGQGKWILKQVLYRHVPKSIMDRPKKGFAVPLDNWLRTDLVDWAEDLLDERSLRQDGLLEPCIIRTRWKEHLSGKRNWMYPLWGVLMFQSWFRQQQNVTLPNTTQIHSQTLS